MSNLYKTVLGCLLVSSITVSTVQAQNQWLKVSTNRPDANVYADSTWLGTASQSVFYLPSGTTEITLVAPTADAWSISPLSQTVGGATLDTILVELTFPHYYRMETVPSGALVYSVENSKRQYLGKTPLSYESPKPLTEELIFTKDGFLTRQIEPGTDLWNRHFVLLEAVTNLDTAGPDLSLKTSSTTKWIDYLAIGTAITGGILAVHYKAKANNRFDDYNKSGTPALKDDVKRFDVYSGVALGAMQVSLGVLAFRLVF